MDRQQAIDQWLRNPENDNARWGCGHIVIEDGNIEDGFILFCLEEFETEPYPNHLQTPELVERTKTFLKSLLDLPLPKEGID
jgi:hypothetical protein